MLKKDKKLQETDIRERPYGIGFVPVAGFASASHFSAACTARFDARPSQCRVVNLFELLIHIREFQRFFADTRSQRCERSLKWAKV